MDNKILGNEKDIIFYNDENGNTQVEVILQDEDVWLNVNSIASLFDVQRPAIVKHISNIYSEEELVVCGGATIYKLALPYVDKMVISEVKKEYQGDACFPSFEKDFILESSEEKEEFIIKIYRRK